MHRIQTWNNKDEVMREGTQKPPFGAGFNKQQVEQAETLELWGSSFTDTGSDFCEFRLLRKGGIIARKRVAGY